jgi:hypothetical protein
MPARVLQCLAVKPAIASNLKISSAWTFNTSYAHTAMPFRGFSIRHAWQGSGKLDADHTADLRSADRKGEQHGLGRCPEFCGR